MDQIQLALGTTLRFALPTLLLRKPGGQYFNTLIPYSQHTSWEALRQYNKPNRKVLRQHNKRGCIESQQDQCFSNFIFLLSGCIKEFLYVEKILLLLSSQIV